MEHKLLVLCDPEADYAQHMADFLRRKMEAFWDILTYTEPKTFHIAAQKEVEILLVAESVYCKLSEGLQSRLTIVLNESGVLTHGELPNIDKYQAAEQVHREMLAYYMERAEDIAPKVQGSTRGRLIGMYSPVRRCLQTTFSLTYGQILAQKHRTLFLSLSYFSDMEEWREEKRQDLSALLYLQQTKAKEFGLHMQAMVYKVGELDCIAPMLNGENLLYITAREWQELLKAIVECGEYEYVILDLSESIQGLFAILCMCDHIYTITREDSRAQCKIQQYEQLLTLQECENVKQKTTKCRIPLFRKLPTEVEQYTKGALADYVRAMIEGLENKCGKGKL